jgi:chromosomal replication initiator protein
MWICPLQFQQIGQTVLLGAPNRIVFHEVERKYFQYIEDFFIENQIDTVKKIKLYLIGDESFDFDEGECPEVFKPSSKTLGPKNTATEHFASRKGVADSQKDLNPDFTFSNFVIGKSNQMAEAAAEQVALCPGYAYNPLFLYGGVGLGKTHLMQAIGNKILANQPNLKVCYLHSERFVSDMVKALQTNTLDDFKAYYRAIDILMIDDIQFFAGKDRSQEELFYTFNTLLESNQQVIITSDRYPKELGGIADRLKSRFGSGLTVAVAPPDLETRVAILLKKSEMMGVQISSDVAFYIAQNIRSNIRELEGAFKRVIAYARFISRPVSLDIAQKAMKEVVAAQERLASVDNIIQVVAEHFRITEEQILSESRQKKYSWPRQIAMALCKELSSLSLPEIGKAFKGRDHTTVLHACRKVADIVQKDPEEAELYHALVKKFSF